MTMISLRNTCAFIAVIIFGGAIFTQAQEDSLAITSAKMLPRGVLIMPVGFLASVLTKGRESALALSAAKGLICGGAAIPAGFVALAGSALSAVVKLSSDPLGMGDGSLQVEEELDIRIAYYLGVMIGMGCTIVMAVKILQSFGMTGKDDITWTHVVPGLTAAGLIGLLVKYNAEKQRKKEQGNLSHSELNTKQCQVLNNSGIESDEQQNKKTQCLVENIEESYGIICLKADPEQDLI